MQDEGVLSLSDGSCCTGEWKGIDGSYEGEWSEDKMHERLVLTWPDEWRNEEECNKDKMHCGKGQCTWVDGRSDEGECKKDKMHRKSKKSMSAVGEPM